MRIKKCENCKWWKGELREYDDFGKFKICHKNENHFSTNSNDSCDNFEFNYIKKKIKKTKLKKALTMTTKNGIKLYIKGIEKEIDKILKEGTSKMTMLQKELKVFKKLKSPCLSDKKRKEYLSGEIKIMATKITETKKYKKGLTYKTVNNNLNKLRKHPDIVGVETGTKGFQIYTKPLKVKSRKIGHYQMDFLYRNPDTIRISNLYKRKNCDSYDHWFVKREIPCFGQWRHGLREYLYSGNIYLVADTLIRFLTSNYHSYKGHISFKEFTYKY